SIDAVPETVSALSESGYAVLSESSRIAEIQEQDQSLQVLVAVTAGGVFLFGVLTVFNVLVDSTDRKRGTIGVLRVMGVSKVGIFLVVLMRASIIGLLAALLCTLAGVLSGEFLSMDLNHLEYLKWKPTISVVTDLTDLLLVAGGAAFCAIAGAVVPAFRASRLDPFDAIMEGRFT
ncbi:FtsX-like permease family protein, partial [bacterium]|nr:FtsX-like permease family protein [bacterium]